MAREAGFGFAAAQIVDGESGGSVTVIALRSTWWRLFDVVEGCGSVSGRVVEVESGGDGATVNSLLSRVRNQ